MLRIITIGFWLLAVAAAAELPVTTVVLYKHGVGYFERSGELAPGESARLDFKASEMDDVLKSLTIGSSGGEGIAALRYDASEPVQQKLDDYPFRLGERAPLSTFLDQLKGEQVTLTYGSQTVSGMIVGARLEATTGEQPPREQVTILLPTGEIVTRNLSAATSIRLPDERLQGQLRDYLAVLTGARSQERRSVYVDSIDSGVRQVRASYMIPAPVWKSSYRLVFGSSGDPTLEGWAIVDNTTGDDWRDVQLALVSGRPISFVTRLYEPKYVARPEAELPEDQAVAPQIHTGAVDEKFFLRDAAPTPEAERPLAGVPGAPSGVGGGIYRSQARAVPMISDVAPAAQGRELGELFEYGFEKPITVRRNESAMLPFLQQKIGARKLLIYADHSSQHPMNAAELTNNTGKTLDGGPITVFDGGAYGGEALMETFKSGDKRLISYGVDLGARITTKFGSRNAVVRELRLSRGLLTTRSVARETRTYTIRNVDGKAKTLILEHPARPGYELLDREADEKTENAYRFEVSLDAGATREFSVSEERLITNTFAVTNLTPDVLVSYIENRELSAEAREKLSAILEVKRAIAQVDSDLNDNQQRTRELATDQDRVRKNIESLNRVSGQQDQVQRYATQLADQEATLARLSDEAQELRSRRRDLERSLDELIEKTEF